MRIDVGLRLKEIEPPHRMWEIVRIIRPQRRTGRRHAQLRLSSDHKTTRMLSLSVIEDGGSYLPVEQ